MRECQLKGKVLNVLNQCTLPILVRWLIISIKQRPNLVKEGVLTVNATTKINNSSTLAHMHTQTFPSIIGVEQ